MKKLLAAIFATLFAMSAVAGHKKACGDGLEAAMDEWDKAYAENDAETYFNYYAEDAVVFFFGERQDLSAYHEEWSASIAAGGGVEMNESHDVVVQMMPGCKVAIATSFIDNRSRTPEGEVSTVRAYETDVWQKIDGEWKVVSLHYSEFVPEE